MEFFKKRGTALVLAVLIVLSSSFISSKVKLQKKCDSVSSLLTVGVKYEGYRHADIVSQLSNICGLIDNFVNFVPQNIDTSALKNAADELRFALRVNRLDAAELARCYNNAVREFNAVKAAMSEATLSDTQARALEEYGAEMSAAQKTVADSGYNEAVREFLTEDMGFFAKFMAKLTGVTLPEYFE